MSTEPKRQENPSPPLPDVLVQAPGAPPSYGHRSQEGIVTSGGTAPDQPTARPPDAPVRMPLARPLLLFAGYPAYVSAAAAALGDGTTPPSSPAPCLPAPAARQLLATVVLPVPPATELPLILSQVSRERYLSKVQGMVTQLLTQSDPAARAAQLAYVAGLAYEARILSDAVSLMFAHLQRELNPAPVPADEPAPAPQERRKARGA